MNQNNFRMINDTLFKLKRREEEKQKRNNFSVLLFGEPGSGKTFLLRTCPKPVFIFSLDPGGTTCLNSFKHDGQIIVDGIYENDDIRNPTAYINLNNRLDKYKDMGLLNSMGTIVIDSLTSLNEAAMAYVLLKANRIGESPRWSTDYPEAKHRVDLIIRKFLSVKNVNQILICHHKVLVDQITGKFTKKIFAYGDLRNSIPAKFDELWGMIRQEKQDENGKRKIVYRVMTQDVKLECRSRMAGLNKLKRFMPADVKFILKAVGREYKDKEILEKKEENDEEKNNNNNKINN